MTIPSEPEILADLARILREDLNREYSGPLSRETRFFADLGLASIDAVVLGEALQNHYDEPLPFGALLAEVGRRSDRDLAVGELVEFVRENLRGRSCAREDRAHA